MYVMKVEMMETGGGENVDDKNLLRLNNDLGREE